MIEITFRKRTYLYPSSFGRQRQEIVGQKVEIFHCVCADHEWTNEWTDLPFNFIDSGQSSQVENGYQDR